jgi:hypothetical protein
MPGAVSPRHTCAVSRIKRLFSASRIGRTYASREELERRVLLSVTPVTIYSFTGNADGGKAWGITVDGSGNLYGITGTGAQGTGDIWELPRGSTTVESLYNVDSEDDLLDVAVDGAGNLYVTNIAPEPVIDAPGILELSKGADSTTYLYKFIINGSPNTAYHGQADRKKDVPQRCGQGISRMGLSTGLEYERNEGRTAVGEF